jgi:hypothetical protein
LPTELPFRSRATLSLSDSNLCLSKVLESLDSTLHLKSSSVIGFGSSLAHQKLDIGDLVLLYNSKHHLSRFRELKLADKWSGPFRIQEVARDFTLYRLEELDGTHLVASFAGNRLKKFFTRKDFIENRRERDEVLQEMDEALENEQREFTEKHADRFRELLETVETAKRGSHSGS